MTVPAHRNNPALCALENMHEADIDLLKAQADLQRAESNAAVAHTHTRFARATDLERVQANCRMMLANTDLQCARSLMHAAHDRAVRARAEYRRYRDAPKGVPTA